MKDGNVIGMPPFWKINTERLIGEVVNTIADDSILTDGKIDLSKFHPITYDCVNHHYIALGEKVGNAFKDGNSLK